jgi:PAS domain-containing protein
MTALGLSMTRPTASSWLVIPLVRLATRRDEALTPWCKLVEDSSEACLVLDPSGGVAAASQPAAELLGEYGPDQVVGHHLLDVVDLVDFHGGSAGAVYADRIAPLIALAGNTLARGLLRVRFSDGSTQTLDSVAVPLHGSEGQLVGTIAFLAAVWT